MDIRKFGWFLIIVSAVGLAVSYALFTSADPYSTVGRAWFSDEREKDVQMAMQRTHERSTYGQVIDETTFRISAEIKEARVARVSNGKMGMLLFAGLGVVAAGLVLSAKPTTETSV